MATAFDIINGLEPVTMVLYKSNTIVLRYNSIVLLFTYQIVNMHTALIN
jgi:hypothetical protein